MEPGSPKFRRRKADRPNEIVEAALSVFVERGFAAARLDDIAARAGVSKGAIYLYFATKEDIFRAVVDQAFSPSMEVMRDIVGAHPGPFPELIRAIAAHMAGVVERTPLGGVAKMVIGEARNLPELARIWRQEVVEPSLDALAAAIQAAQGRGEVRAGDPRAFALQFAAPLIVGVIWRETFVPIGAPAFDMPTLVRQHADTFLRGVRPGEGP